MATLSRVKKSAQEWDYIMGDHREAMVVRDVEDAVDYGILALKVWFRTIEDWHTDVSQSANRYSGEEHERIKKMEQFLLTCGRRMNTRIAEAQKQGYEVDGAKEFATLLDRLEACARPIEGPFAKTTLKEVFDDAVREHDSGATEAVDNPWKS